MSLAWPVIEPEGNLDTSRLGEKFHRGALLDVLPNEPVRVLIRAALPGVVGSGEIEGGACSLFDLAVTVKLGSVVDSDGLEQVSMGADELNDAAVHGSDRASTELTDE